MYALGSEPLLITGGYSREVQFRDAVRGDIRRKLALPEKTFGHVNRLAVSNVSGDALQLAVAGNPDIAVYPVEGTDESQEPLVTYRSHKGNVTAVGYEARDRWLYTGSEDGTIRVWDLRTQGCTHCHENEGTFVRNAVFSVDIHPNQVELIAGDSQGRVLVWDLVANKVRRTLIPEEGVPVRSVRASPDGRVLVCANHNGKCYVYHLEDDSFYPLQKIDAHSAYVLSVAFCPEGKQFATTSADSTTRLWKWVTEGFGQTFTLTGHSKWVWDSVFTSDGQYLATGSSDCSCRIWETRTGVPRVVVQGFTAGVTAIALIDAVQRLS